LWWLEPGGGRAKAQCPGLGGCRLKALPALSEKLNKKSTEQEDLSVFHFCDWRRLAFKLSAFRARLQLGPTDAQKHERPIVS